LKNSVFSTQQRESADIRVRPVGNFWPEPQAEPLAWILHEFTPLRPAQAGTPTSPDDFE
jgi:hypothetical protein